MDIWRTLFFREKSHNDHFWSWVETKKNLIHQNANIQWITQSSTLAQSNEKRHTNNNHLAIFVRCGNNEVTPNVDFTVWRVTPSLNVYISSIRYQIRTMSFEFFASFVFGCLFLRMIVSFNLLSFYSKWRPINPIGLCIINISINSPTPSRYGNAIVTATHNKQKY